MRFIEQLIKHSNQTNGLAIRTENQDITYKTLLHRVKSVMTYLSEKGVNEKSVVGVTITNELDHLIITIALFGLGSKQLIIPSYDSYDVQYDFAKRVKMDVYISEFESDFFPKNTIIFSANLAYECSIDISCSEIEGHIYIKTSGTTGKPNIVPFTESQLVIQAQRVKDYSQEVLLRLASMEYNNSKRHRLYSIWNGGVNVFKPQKEFDVVDYILEKDVSCLDVARIHIANLTKHPKAHMLSHIKIRAGGSLVSFTLREEIENNVTKELYLRYGATEFGTITMTRPGEYDADVCSGKCVDGVQLQIVGSDDVPLPKGSVGYVRIKATGMAERYFDNPAQSKKRFRDGWFYPGDLAYLREDEQLILKGREDDMINMNGINIYGSEIEEVLEKHKYIKTAAAVPIESSIHGQIPVAAIELEVNESITAQDILHYSREKLGIRSPRKVVICNSLPRTPQGKVIKNKVQCLFKEKV